MTNHSEDNNPRIILREQLPELTGHTMNYIYRLMQAHRFPEPVRLDDNRKVWLESEVSEWLKYKTIERAKTLRRKLDNAAEREAKLRHKLKWGY